MRNMLDFCCFKIINKDLFILLRERDNESEPEFKKFTIIGGQVREKDPRFETFDYDLEAARKRIIEQKIGVEPSYIEELKAVGSIDRDARDWTITLLHYCFFYEDKEFSDNFKWVKVSEVLNKNINLPFDHNKLVEECYFGLKNKIKYSSIILNLLPEEFIISELVSLFSTFDLDVSKQTISNRFIRNEIIIPTGEKRKNDKGGKPALVFKLNNKNIEFFESSIGAK